MNIGQSILEALETLSGNKLRSGLTILGIVIGVGAVIAMLSIGQGAQDSITGAISGIGTNLLFVSSGNMTGCTQYETSDVERCKRHRRPAGLDVMAVAPLIRAGGYHHRR
jgi:ABC-type lipoprotein release transport system permease subunit